MLFSGTFLVVYFLICANRLHKSANGIFSFDQFVLIVESLKLFLFLISQFVFLHQSMLVAVQILQSVIQFVICCSFIDKVINIAKYNSLRKYVYSLLILVFLAFLTITVYLVTVPGQMSCNSSTLGKDWGLFLGMGVIQSVLIVLSGYYLNK